MIPHPPPEAAQLNLKPFLPWEAITLFLNWPYRCAAEPSSGNQCPEGLPVRNGFTTEPTTPISSPLSSPSSTSEDSLDPHALPGELVKNDFYVLCFPSGLWLLSSWLFTRNGS